MSEVGAKQTTAQRVVEVSSRYIDGSRVAAGPRLICA